MQAPERIRDLKHVHERLGTLTKLVATHVDEQPFSSGWADMRRSIVRARVKVGEQLKRVEGKQ